jgi:PAS domain S-box-containing protein
VGKRRGVTDFLSVFQSDGAVFFDLETDILVKLNEYGNIVRVNPAFEKILGYSELEVIGKSLIEIASMRDLDQIDPKALRLLRKGGGEVVVKVEDWRYRKPYHYAIFRRI